MGCKEDKYCVACPYLHCIYEEDLFQRLVRYTKNQVERWGLHWIDIWFEEEDAVARRAFERYRKWLRDYGFEGNEPTYKKWIVHNITDPSKPVVECGCHSGTFYFKPINNKKYI